LAGNSIFHGIESRNVGFQSGPPAAFEANPKPVSAGTPVCGDNFLTKHATFGIFLFIESKSLSFLLSFYLICHGAGTSGVFPRITITGSFR
jgi:hypothetical protein